jgi:hypothetical protein
MRRRERWRTLARRAGRSSAPRVWIRHEGETDVISLAQGDPVAASVVVMDALGICEADFASWYLSQIIDVAKPGARADEKATTTVTLDGASIAAAIATRVEKIVTGAITSMFQGMAAAGTNGDSGHDGRAGPTYPDHVSGVGHN